MTASTEYTYINPRMLQELSNEDSSFISEIIEIFLKDVPASYKKMTQALEESDLQTVARQAHKLKPSSGIIGADVATNLALQIEVIAEKNDPNKQLPSMLKSLGNALDNCYRDLSKYQSEVQN